MGSLRPFIRWSTSSVGLKSRSGVLGHLSSTDKIWRNLIGSTETWQELTDLLASQRVSLNDDSVRKAGSKHVTSLLRGRPVYEAVVCSKLIHPSLLSSCLDLTYWEMKHINLEEVEAMLMVLHSVATRLTPHSGVLEILPEFINYVQKHERIVQDLSLVLVAKACEGIGRTNLACGTFLFNILERKCSAVFQLSPAELTSVAVALSYGYGLLTPSHRRLAERLKVDFFSNLSFFTPNDAVSTVFSLHYFEHFDVKELRAVEHHVGDRIEFFPPSIVRQLVETFAYFRYKAQHIDIVREFLRRKPEEFTTAYCTMFHYTVAVCKQVDVVVLQRLIDLMALPVRVGVSSLRLVVASLVDFSGHGESLIGLRKVALKQLAQLTLTAFSNQQLQSEQSAVIHLCYIVNYMSKCGLCPQELFVEALRCVDNLMSLVLIARLAYTMCSDGSLQSFIPSLQLVWQRWARCGDDDLNLLNDVFALAISITKLHIYEQRALEALERFGMLTPFDENGMKLHAVLVTAFADVRFQAPRYFDKLLKNISGAFKANALLKVKVFLKCASHGLFTDVAAAWLETVSPDDLRLVTKSGSVHFCQLLSLLHLLTKKQSGGVHGLQENVYLSVTWVLRNSVFVVSEKQLQPSVQRCLETISELLAVKLLLCVVTDAGSLISGVLFLSQDTGKPCRTLPPNICRAGLSAERVREFGLIPVALCCLHQSNYIRGSECITGPVLAKLQVLSLTGWAVLPINLRTWEECENRRAFLEMQLAFCDDPIAFHLLAGGTMQATV